MLSLVFNPKLGIHCNVNSPGYQVFNAPVGIESYVGHPISSDNGLISRKFLLKSEFYLPIYV